MIQGLSTEVNLGSGFLRRISTAGVCTQLHFHPDGIKLQIRDEVVKLEDRRVLERFRLINQQERDLTQLESETNRAGTAEILVLSGRPRGQNLWRSVETAQQGVTRVSR